MVLPTPTSSAMSRRTGLAQGHEQRDELVGRGSTAMRARLRKRTGAGAEAEADGVAEEGDRAVVAEFVGRVGGRRSLGDGLESGVDAGVSSSLPPSGRSTRRWSSGVGLGEDDPLAAAGADEGADGEGHAGLRPRVARKARKGLGFPDQLICKRSRARVMAT
jgi:hypothetical protein